MFIKIKDGDWSAPVVAQVSRVTSSDGMFVPPAMPSKRYKSDKKTVDVGYCQAGFPTPAVDVTTLTSNNYNAAASHLANFRASAATILLERLSRDYPNDDAGLVEAVGQAGIGCVLGRGIVFEACGHEIVKCARQDTSRLGSLPRATKTWFRGR